MTVAQRVAWPGSRLGSARCRDRVGADRRPAQGEPQRLRAQRRGRSRSTGSSASSRRDVASSSTGGRAASSGMRSTWVCFSSLRHQYFNSYSGGCQLEGGPMTRDRRPARRTPRTTRRRSTGGDLPLPPARHVAVLACMDARLNVFGLLGPAGGRRPCDPERRRRRHRRRDPLDRDLATAARDEGDHPDPPHRLRHAHVQRRGLPPPAARGDGCRARWDAEAFADLEIDVRKSIARIKDSPFIPEKGSIRGFVYDVHTGRLDEVTCASAARLACRATAAAGGR